MLKTMLGLAAATALALPLSLTTADVADAKPKWKEGKGWSGGPPPWAPAHGWRRKHRAYGYAPRPYPRYGSGYYGGPSYYRY